MSFGKRLLEVRKKRGLSQEEVAQLLGTKAPVIGRYERDEAKPSIEAATKLSNLLGVSLDYLAGKTDQELDQDILNRVLTIQKLPEKDREYILFALDALIRDAKARSAYGT